MVTLAMTSVIGATEGALYSSYQRAQEPLLVFSTKETAFIGKGVDVRLPLGADLGGPFHLGRALEQLVADRGVTSVLSVGREAGWFAARHLSDVRYSALLLRGDLDLSPRRPADAGLFKQIAATAGELVLEDHWEMDKAVVNGSQVPHHRMPLLTASAGTVLSGIGTRVAVLHDRGKDPKSPMLSRIVEACERRGVPCDLVQTRSLYTRRDLDIGRTLDRALQRRLGPFTHVVVTGDPRDTAAVVAALSGQADRVLLEGTIASTTLAGRVEGVTCARGTALIDRLQQMLDGWSSKRRTPLDPAVSLLYRARTRPGTPGRLARGGTRGLDWVSRQRRGPRSGVVGADPGLPAFFHDVPQRDVPWFHEELWDADTAPGDFDVFFTVAPVENRANGARPQRVRNAAEAVHSRGPAMVLRPHDLLLDRRARLVQALVDQGWRPRMVYGENSTSPIESREMIDRVAALFRWFGEHGALRAWFVRDLHWLSTEQVRGYSPTTEMVERGLYELTRMAGVTEQFLAPNEGSREEFAELLRDRCDLDVRWESLPPALHPDNVCSIEGLAERGTGLTLVYAGGTNGFYRQDVFLQAVAELSAEPGFHLDLVVRESEGEHLAESLERAGVVPEGTIRVITDDLSTYVPLTRNALGVALLDGRYATRAFPYKTVSMLERGLHVLCFEDMAITSFLRRYDAGVFCERDVRSVVEAVRAYRDRHDRIDVPALMANESWTARLDGLWASLVAQRTP